MTLDNNQLAFTICADEEKVGYVSKTNLKEHAKMKIKKTLHRTFVILLLSLIFLGCVNQPEETPTPIVLLIAYDISASTNKYEHATPQIQKQHILRITQLVISRSAVLAFVQIDGRAFHPFIYTELTQLSAFWMNVLKSHG